MTSIRDIKRAARRNLHHHMRVAAMYVPSTGAAPKLLHVRLHTKWGATTIDSPTNSGTMVDRQSIFPKILFMLDEVEAQGVRLRKKGIISVETGEAYELDHSEPADDISQSWIVVQLDADDTTGLPVPGAD